MLKMGAVSYSVLIGTVVGIGGTAVTLRVLKTKKGKNGSQDE
jgi:hypothetical protein